MGGFDDGLSGELPYGNEAYALAGEYARKAIDAHGGAVMSEAEWTSVANGFNVPASSWTQRLPNQQGHIRANSLHSRGSFEWRAVYSTTT